MYLHMYFSMTTQLMTNIDQSLYNFITQLAKEQHKNKRTVLEEIIISYKKTYTQEKLEQAYIHMSNDEAYLLEMQENTTLLGTI